VLSSTISKNGTAAQFPAPTFQGRGLESLADTQLTIRSSTVSNNHDGGILIDNISSTVEGVTTIEYCTITGNGTNGVIYGNKTRGLVRYNALTSNGTAGVWGPNGYNGLEVLQGWKGSSMVIDANTFAFNTGNGALIGSGVVNVVNNFFNDNWVAMTIFNAPTVPATVTIKSNVFNDAPPVQTGVFIQETWGNPNVTIGGPTTTEKNVFQNYGNRPAIACNAGTANTNCRLSWNSFINSSFPVSKCNCP
jgi:hypothetical protein